MISPPVHPGPSRVPPLAAIARVPSAPIDLPLISSRSSVFSPFIPSSLGARKSQSNISRNVSVRTKSTVGNPNSRPLEDLDIAGLLEVASVTHRESEIEPQLNSASATPTPAVPPSSLASSLKAKRLSLGWRRSHRDLDVPLSSLKRVSDLSCTGTWGSSVLAQETGVGQRTSSTSSREAGARSRGKTPVRF